MRTKKDIFKDIVLHSIRPLVWIWMFFDMRVEVNIGEGVNIKTKNRLGSRFFCSATMS